MQIFTDYLKALTKFKTDSVTEHTYRTDLENLLNAIKDTVNKKYKIMQEPQRDDTYGAPDYRISFNDMVVGYVENKKIGKDLKEVLTSDQIKRYIKLSDNILLTNYLDWVWIRKGKESGRASLCTEFELADRKFAPSEDRVKAVLQLITNFYSIAPEGIAEPKKLAKALAERAKQLKKYLWDELDRQHREDTEGRLFGLYNTFQKLVDHELTLESFTDTFAQMLVYGLFMARLNSGKEKIDLYTVKKFIPGSFELIRELVGFLEVLHEPQYTETKWIVEEVLSILNTMDVDSIHRLLSFNTVSGKSKKKNSMDPCLRRDDDSSQPTSNEAMMHDPFIYFYEDFLAAYDKALKKAKGVYYTPLPVVNFIVRAIDDILKDTFGIADGLADNKKVTVLDFACGTGTFILEIVRQILENSAPAKHDLLIKEHILKNIYGFEYMMAPYTVAHLKLSQYLKDKGYQLSDQEHLNVFLTNTLEHQEAAAENLLPALSKESKSALKVKDKPILVITGNPPYSYVSKNNSDFIKGLIKDYYFVDGKPLGERNPKGLQDDYVKFIRFAQWKMEQVEEGIVAIITNHSFLDNPTFRGMRQSLMQTFNQMYFLDLHGNAKKKEKAPDGSKDENVFDIMQGVCISLLIKDKSEKREIHYAEYYGSRDIKYRKLYDDESAKLDWKAVTISKQNLFIAQDNAQNVFYDTYLSIQDIFNLSNVGIVTARDSLTIQDTKEQIEAVVKDFASLPIEEARKKYKLGVDSRDWKIKDAQADIAGKYNSKNVVKIQYRPFDVRYTYYTSKIKGFLSYPRYDVMQHMLLDNIGMLSVRQSTTGIFNHCFATDKIIDKCTISNLTKEGTYLYPLYLYEEVDFLGTKQVEKKPNIKTEVIKELTAKYAAQAEGSVGTSVPACSNTGETPVSTITPEQIMSYIYAVLHSPTYRSKYADFLKTDFPRIPFTDDFKVFSALAEPGWDLIQAHLQKSTQPEKLYPKLGGFTEKGDNTVANPHYTDSQSRLFINGTQYFDNVPADVYNFYIGGYQVLQKYLKDRKGRTLTLDEINNVENVVKILQFTIDTMQKIDALTKEWI